MEVNGPIRPLSRRRVRRAAGPPLSVLLVVGKKRKSSAEPLDAPIDLASRIGMPAAPGALARPEPAAPEPVRRVDGPIEGSRGRPLLIGANERVPAPIPAQQPEVATNPSGRSMLIGLGEALVQAVAPAPAPVALVEPVVDAPAMEYAPLAATTREAPATGEMDLVVTPLPTPDDWHHFELALRRVPGVGPLRIEYYRAGILKLRLQWSGNGRFAQAIANVPGYRVGILGEDRRTVQIRVTPG